MTPHQHNTLVGVALFLGTSIICGFSAAVMGARSGEIAAALGSVVGGMLGALGAAAAVYLTLKGQREDETEKISAAIIIEIATLAKFPIEQLVTCRAIYQGQLSAPRHQLPTLMQTPMPTLYQGAAEHIARVTRPALVVAFYTGLAETQATVNVIVAHPSVSPRIEPNDVEGIGVLLVEQCKLARQILSSAPIVRGTDSDLVAQMLRIIIKRLDEEIAASAGVFPTAPQYETKTKVG